MKKRKKLPKSIRKHIRQEKALIRRQQVLDLEEQKKRIEEIYKKLGIKRNKLVSFHLSGTETIGLAKKKIK